MSQSSNSQLPEVSIKRLLVLVWVLVVLTGLNLIATLAMGITPSVFAQRLNRQIANQQPIGVQQDPYENFHSWPLEKQLRTATLVLRMEYQKDGNRYKSIIREVIKQNADTKFYYKIGDEFPELSMMQEKDCVYGDGQIAFLVGSPAEMRYATSYSNNKLSALGGMPLDDLKQLAKKVSSNPS